jgi:hypothetical protein
MDAIAALTPAIAIGLAFTSFIKSPPRLHIIAVITSKRIALGLSFKDLNPIIFNSFHDLKQTVF